MKLVKFISWAIIILYLQVLVVPRLAIAGAEPNLIVPFIIFISSMLGATSSLTISFFLGMSIDILNPELFGLNTLIYIIISYIVIRIHPNVNKIQLTLVALSILMLNAIYLILFLISYFILSYITFQFFLNMLISFIYNSIFSFAIILLLAFLDRLHFKLYD